MEKLIIILVIGLLIFTAALAITFRENKTFERRKNQNRNLLKENIIKKKLEELTTLKVKASKRMATEKLCLQAGYNISYADYIIINIISAIVCAVLFNVLFSNILLGIIFLVIGYFIPSQFFMVKRNKRITKMDEQVGSCLKMIIERYKNTKNMKKAIEDTALEFHNEPPLGAEMERMVISINLGKSVEDSLDEFASRTGNKYLQRFSDYYKICSEIGTTEVREMLNQALLQYREDRHNKLLLKKEISSVKSEAYIVLAGVPFVAIYQSFMDPEYVSFMTTTVVGQVGTALIVTAFMCALWFINKKIGAPIE